MTVPTGAVTANGDLKALIRTIPDFPKPGIQFRDVTAAARLLRRAGAEVTESVFIIDLPELGGGARLCGRGMKVHNLVEFEGD